MDSRTSLLKTPFKLKKLATSCIFVLLSTVAENWSQKLCHSIGLPLNLGISISGSLASIWLLFCGLEETLSKSRALVIVGLVVDGKERQASILYSKSCILPLNKKVMFISLSNSSTWTNSEISLFNRFIYSFCSATLFLYDFNFDIWSKFPGTNSSKNIVISFSSLL